MARIDRDFAAKLLDAVDDSDAYGVHQLFNDWWRYAPADVIAKYEFDFGNLPEHRAFVDARYYAPTLELEDLEAMPEGTLGRAYGHFIRDNGLATKLATDYRVFHEHLRASGKLDAMPEDLQYAILRGFQMHDFLHVLTGYDSSGLSEIGLQAFSLAQLRFPYFGMWLSVMTTRMTFNDPDLIVPVMDAITRGWQLGRSVGQLSFERWEERLDEPLIELRRQKGIDASGLLPLAA